MTEGTGVDRSPVWMGDGRLVAGTSGGGDVQGRPDPPGLLIVRREDPRNTQRIPLDGFAGHTISPSAVTSDGRIVFSALRVDQEPQRSAAPGPAEFQRGTIDPSGAIQRAVRSDLP
jgi:hypothetical protein